MKLEPRQRTTRRNESRDIVVPIIRALNRLPGVRVSRNNNVGKSVPVRFYTYLLGSGHAHPHYTVVDTGLGEGSADIVGLVLPGGRALALEVKLPPDRDAGLRAGPLKPDQRRWLAAFRRFGGYADVVHGVEEAIAAVEACRRGESGSTVL